MDNQNVLQELEVLKAKVQELESSKAKDKLSMVIMSGDMDKMLGAFIIATGAVAMDTEVSIFLSFWSVSAFRKKKMPKVKKDFISKMFASMLPKGASKLPLSKMNFSGMGPIMMKHLMKKKNVTSLEDMIKMAGELGIQVNICEMSMDLMGFTREEIIDYPNIEFCGVGTYLADASESQINLFI